LKSYQAATPGSTTIHRHFTASSLKNRKCWTSSLSRCSKASFWYSTSCIYHCRTSRECLLIQRLELPKFEYLGYYI